MAALARHSNNTNLCRVNHRRIDIGVELLQNGLAVFAASQVFAFVAREPHGVDQIMEQFDRRNVACRIHIILDEGDADVVAGVGPLTVSPRLH